MALGIATVDIPTDSTATELEFLVGDAGSDQVVASTSHGLWGSNDGGVTWTDHTNNLAPRDVASLAVSSDGTAVFAGTRGGGVLRLVR